MHLSVIIVNYNVKYFLEQCLHAVLKACVNLNAEIFVIDNHSTDGSREYLQPKFPEIIFKWNQQNAGFAKACNSVSQEVTGDYVLFLNPDTIIPEDCFDKCISFFRENNSCGALGVRMIDGSGKFLKESKRSFPTALAAFFKISGFAKAFPSSKIFARYYAGHLPANASHETDVLAGAFMMLRKETLDKVHGFDEAFFMYGEDIDLSYRVKLAGFKNYYFAGTTIIHFKGESTVKASRTYINHFYGAMQLFINKHYKEKKAGLFIMRGAIQLSKWAAAISLYFGNKFSEPNYSSDKSAGHTNTVIVGDHLYSDEIFQLIRFAKKPLNIVSQVAINNDEGKPINMLSDIENNVKQHAVSKIIFCEGGNITNSAIINLIEQIREVEFLFHGRNTKSIVGSTDANSGGIFIAE